VQDASGRSLLRQEASQPPLYYILGALATFWINTEDAEELLWYNPQANIGKPTEPGNKNVFVHVEGFPYRGTALAVHMARMVSLLFGTGTVLLTYLIALEVFPGRKSLAIGAAAFNAFIPQFIFISVAVNNDNAANFFCSLALLLIIRLLCKTQNPNDQIPIGSLVIGHWSLLGLVLGLAALSKLNTLGLFPLMTLTFAFIASRRRSLKFFIQGIAIVLSVAFLVAGWWYIRNWLLYRDPTGLKAMFNVVGRREVSLLELLGEMGGLRVSFWALFGWFSIPVSPLIYKALDFMSLLAFLGLGIWFVRRKGKGKKAPAVLALWSVIVFSSLIRWTSMTEGTQGRLLFPAISSISILLVLGLSQWIPRGKTSALAIVITASMFAFSSLCPFLYIAPAYAKPPLVDKIPAEISRLNVDFGGKIRLIGCELDRKVAKAGEMLGITLYWESLAEMERDYYLFIHLLGRGYELVGGEDTYHGWGTYPTSLWKRGEILRDAYKVLIREDALAPTLCRVDVGIYDPATGEGLQPFDEEGEAIKRMIVVGELKLIPREHRAYEIENPVYFNLEDKIALIGYKVRLDKEILLTLYWKAISEIEEDYTVFTHLTDEDGIILSQHDSQPLGGDYPTSIWEVGEVVEDEHVIVVKENALVGGCRLEVGMYRLSDGRRLEVFDAEGKRLPGDRVLLEMFTL
jgi:hypothetical protein